MVLMIFFGVPVVVSVFGWWASKVPTAGAKRAGRAVSSSCPAPLRFAMAVFADPLIAARMWELLGLGSPNAGFPGVLSVTGCPVGARLEFTMPMGQSVDDWRNRSDELAGALTVPKVRVIDTGCGTVAVELMVFDPLAAGRRSMVPTGSVDLEAVVAGRTESGEYWRVPVIYRHHLIAGASNAGKSGMLWSLLAGMAPAIRDGLVEVWAVDPKRVELAPGRGLFTRYVGGVNENVVALMTDLVAVMDERLDRMEAAGIRKHVPTVDEPAIVVAVDEVLVVTALAPDKEFGKEMDRVLRYLMSLGRAAAVSVIVLGQDPSKDIMAWRQMATWRVALRMTEKTQTAMVLGDSARDEGVRCDEIPENTPGVAWVGEEGRTGFQRVRAFEVTDDDIATLVRLYAPRPRPADLDAIAAFTDQATTTYDSDDDPEDERNVA